MEQPTRTPDVITDTLLQEARDVLPAWVIADTPEGPAISRSSEPPDDATKAWVNGEDETGAVTLREIMERFGADNVLLYLEPEPWDVGAGGLVEPEENENKDPKDPYRAPTNVSPPAPAVTTPPAAPPAMTASVKVAWSDGPLAALIEQRATEAVSVLDAEIEQLGAGIARLAAIGPAALAAPPEADTDLEQMFFGSPEPSPMNMLTAAVLGNAEAQKALVESWKAAYKPGMTRDELVAAAFPPRPPGPMAATQAWDAAAHEADGWLANQNGMPPPPEGPPETPPAKVRSGVTIPEEIPLLTADEAKAAKIAAAGMKSGGANGSTTLSERQHQQRRDAARISAERRRKNREQERLQRSMQVKKRAGNVRSSDFQEAMTTFARNGVRGADMTQGNSYVSGNGSDAHERLLNSAHEMGYEINTFEDGSGFMKKGGHVVQLGAPANDAERGSSWSGDGVRLARGGSGIGQQMRTPYEKPKKPKKPKTTKYRSAFPKARKR